jgi:hypothetical protein
MIAATSARFYDGGIEMAERSPVMRLEMPHPGEYLRYRAQRSNSTQLPKLANGCGTNGSKRV